MVVPIIRSAGLDHRDIRPVDNSVYHGGFTDAYAPVVDVQQELNNAAEEMAEILSVFGRSTRIVRRKDSEEHDFTTSILEDNADEKLNMLIKQVARPGNHNNLLNLARQLFPNESDLLIALREMLLSRRLSALQKKKIKESLADLEKFGDRQKMQSGINVALLAKKFSLENGSKPLLARDLRNSYLSFLELDIPAGFIYKNWIDVYGCQNRQRLLSFTLSALVADMKANEPGIHFSEFGPLSAKLSDARVLYTIDRALNERFKEFPFLEEMRNKQMMLQEEDIVCLYIAGVVDPLNFNYILGRFSHDFMSLLMIKHRGRVIQLLRNVFSMTPDTLFADTLFRDFVLNIISSLLLTIHQKEKSIGIWNEYYK